MRASFYFLAVTLSAGFALPIDAHAQRRRRPQQEAAQEAPAPQLSQTDQEARSLFEAGRIAFESGRFSAALDYFQRAYDLSHRPQLLYNIGATNDRLRRDTDALAAFRHYLEEVPDASNREEVQARIAVLERSAQPAPEEPHVTQPAQSESVIETWWFWTIIGVVVVGAAVGIGVGVAAANPSLQAPITGTNGAVTYALVSF